MNTAARLSFASSMRASRHGITPTNARWVRLNRTTTTSELRRIDFGMVRAGLRTSAPR
jgi:hypothetical protein